MKNSDDQLLPLLQGWNDQTQQSESAGMSATVEGTLPSKKQAMVELFITKSKIDIPYTATAEVSFEVEFIGWLQ